MKAFCRLSYRIPFSETDAMGIVHHSNHARYFERGRVELMRLVGMEYTEVVRQGFHLPLTELKVAFKKALAFDQVIQIETAVARITRTRVDFTYRIFIGGELIPPALTQEPLPGQPAVLGETFHCCVTENGRPVEISAQIRETLQNLGASS